MIAALPGAEAAKLLKIVSLFDSDNDGEALAALRSAKSLAQRHGFRIQELLTVRIQIPSFSALKPIPATPVRDWQRQVMLCRSVPHLFDRAARDFLANLRDRDDAPTSAQSKWLGSLHRQAQRHLSEVGDAA